VFFKGSRYARVAELQITDRKGRTVRYKNIRFIPRVEARLGHTVNQSERLDHIAQRFYNDPERFWRICDANLALFPDDLVAQPGVTILIPPAEE
jgi:hypothetical protein